MVTLTYLKTEGHCPPRDTTAEHSTGLTGEITCNARHWQWINVWGIQGIPTNEQGPAPTPNRKQNETVGAKAKR